eukprot:scaffold4008_cov267-Pinguiococcus_pyrenoidosus.AAC.2
MRAPVLDATAAAAASVEALKDVRVWMVQPCTCSWSWLVRSTALTAVAKSSIQRYDCVASRFETWMTPVR